LILSSWRRSSGYETVRYKVQVIDELPKGWKAVAMDADR